MEPLTAQEDEIVRSTRGPNSTLSSLARTDPRTITLTQRFSKVQSRIRNMKVLPDDVWVITPPKCGTTWTQEITWLVMNKADTATAKAEPLFKRTPFLDFVFILEMPDEQLDGYLAQIDSQPSPRFIKSHLPFELLPEGLVDKCKVIFVSRNVKDAAVSYFHHERLMKPHDLLIESFERYAVELYKPGLIMLGDYFAMLESGLKLKDHPNLLFLWYEVIKKDQKEVIRKIAAHTGYALTEEEIATIEDYSRFDNMKKTCTLNQPNPMYFEGKGQFLRKGQVGDWRNHFSPELTAEWDQWIVQELDKLGVTDNQVREYFGLETQQ